MTGLLIYCKYWYSTVAERTYMAGTVDTWIVRGHTCQLMLSIITPFCSDSW